MFSFLFEHPKKVAAAVSLSMAIVGYSGLSRLKALAEPLQEEAQALMIRQASRDMGRAEALERSANTTPRGVEVFLNAFAAKLNGLFGLENLVRNLKSTPTTDRAARAALLNDLHLKSMAGCVTAVYALSFFTAAIRLVTALFEALRPQLDSAAGPAINAEELKAGVIHALAVSVLEAGVPAVARLVTDETAKAIAGSPVGLPDAVDMPAIERFFHGVLRMVEGGTGATKPLASSPSNGIASPFSPSSSSSAAAAASSRVLGSPLRNDFFVGDLPSVASSGGHSSGSDDSKGPDERCPPPVAFYTPNPVITLMIGSNTSAVRSEGMDRLASNILACVWDLMESPGFAVAYENAVHASLDVLLGDILRSCFPSPSSALSSPSSESSPSPAPVSAARAAGPVKLANIVLNLYMVLKRLLRAEVTECIPSVVSASPALTEFCGMLLNRALIPSNLVSGSRTTAGATW